MTDANTPFIVHHKANLDGQPFPPNSLEMIRASLEAHPACIEIDAAALADRDFLIVHDDMLESETTGSGLVSECTFERAQSLYFKPGPDCPGSFRVPLLSEVVRLVQAYPGGTRLQVDFKNFFPFSDDEPLHRLAAMLRPLGERVIVSSSADWQLRKLRRFAPWLDIGFDIQFFLDWRVPGVEYDSRMPPYRQGAYGYHDDSLIALACFWPVRDYLADRCEALLRQVAGISTVYINHPFLVKCLDEGFNWVEAAAAAGLRLNTWTLDVDDAAALANAARLYRAGLRWFTSNTPLALAEYLIGLPGV